MTNKLPKLLYIGDPMCSWCYGFSKEISNTVTNLKDIVDFEMIMGGLRPYNTKSITTLSSFLKEHWEHIEKKTKMPFSYTILNDGSFLYDTEPSCRAVVTMRHLDVTKTLAFFKAIQTAFYSENKDTTKDQTFVDLAVHFGIDASIFKQLFVSDEMKIAVKEDFERTASLGVNGFPTVLLKYNDQHKLISNGYTNTSYLIDRVHDHLGKL